MQRIKIHYDKVRYRLKDNKEILKLINKVIRNEKKVPGDLNFILTGDEDVLLLNREFLNHDYLTDVIAFDNNDGNRISGEIYISIDTVKRNADNYKVSLRNEVLRVMIHGTLHLCGFEDKSDKEKEIMKRKEDYWLRISEEVNEL